MVSRLHAAAGLSFVALGAVLIAGQVLAFDAVVEFVARTMSRDGVVTVAGETMLAGYWYAAATAALFVTPHPSLAGLALITFYSGLVLHLEIFEVLLALFIVFYSHRVYRATVHQSGTLAVLGSLSANGSLGQQVPQQELVQLFPDGEHVPATAGSQ